MVSKSSDFSVCPPILNSHSIRAWICLRRKFTNQQNAQHTAAVHYKHLRPALQLLVNLQRFSYLTHNVRHSRATVVRLNFIVNWHVSIHISLEVSLSLQPLVYWRQFLLKICLKMFENERRKAGVGNLRPARTFDMARIRIFVANLEYKIAS